MFIPSSSRLVSSGHQQVARRARAGLVLLALVCLFLLVPAMRGIGLTGAPLPTPEPAHAAADAAARAAVAEHVTRP